MAKVLQVVIYTAISDEAKLAAYARLAGPAMQAAGGVFLARGVPVAVAEDGQMTRTVVVEWASLEAAQAGYNSPAYQEALAALGDGATREFRYVEAV